jgi:hypothetical protein
MRFDFNWGRMWYCLDTDYWYKPRKYRRDPDWPQWLGWRGGYDIGPLIVRCRFSRDILYPIGD